MKQPCVYILTNKRNGTLYGGMSGNLAQRLEQHLTGESNSFVKKYKLNMLVFIGLHDTIESAALREKQIKEWQRAWKLQLIEAANPQWQDLRYLLN